MDDFKVRLVALLDTKPGTRAISAVKSEHVRLATSLRLLALSVRGISYGLDWGQKGV